MIDPEKYKYGYYSIPHLDKKSKSKREIIEHCSKFQGWPNWHFHDELYSLADWRIEPPQTLNELYQERAKNLREKYDYLVILYSGGIDSHNMLMSFLSQNIIPEEIAVFFHSYDNGGILAQEWQAQTMPRLKKIQEQYPQIKIRQIDLTSLILTYLPKYIDDLAYLSTSMAPNNNLRGHLSEFVKDWADLKHTGKTIRLLYGVDKPRLRYKNNQFIFNFYDHTGNTNQDTTLDDSEWFYWGYDYSCVKLCIKQGHVVKRYWEEKLDNLINYNCQFNNNLGWVLDKENQQVSHLIYPFVGDDLFLTWRVTEQINGTRDHAILTSNLDIAEQYLKMFNGQMSIINPMYFNKQQSRYGFVSILSKDYFLS